MSTIICKEVIIATLTRRGAGVEVSPIRIITEVFEKDGTKIAEHDPCAPELTRADVLAYNVWYAKTNGNDLTDKEALNYWIDYIKPAL